MNSLLNHPLQQYDVILMLRGGEKNIILYGIYNVNKDNKALKKKKTGRKCSKF